MARVVGLDIGVSGVYGKPHVQAPKQASGGSSFQDAFQTELLKNDGVKLSAHAQKRLAERNISLSENEQARLDAAVDKINQKGADKSLVLMDDMALLVSARNRVVITALDSTSAKENVFTNIDSAVIA